MRVVVLFLLLAFDCYAEFPSQSEVRSTYQKAATEERSCRSLIKLLAPYNEKNNPLLGGYNACATMMLAKYMVNPFSKLAQFSKGKSLLEKCIAADNQKVELRFLRYTIQKKAPFFLYYKSSIKQDEEMIVKALSNTKDLELKKMMQDFLKSVKSI